MSGQRGKYVKGLPGEKVRIEGVTIGRELPTSIWVTMPDGNDTNFPLSQVHEMHRSKDKGGDVIVVSQWIAEKKGLR